MSRQALIFGVGIDTSTGELSTQINSFWMKEFDKLENSEGYITGIRPDLGGIDKIQLLYQYVTSDKDDYEGLYYVKLDLQNTADQTLDFRRVGVGDNFYQSVFMPNSHSTDHGTILR